MEDTRLAKGVLGIKEAYGQAMAVTAPLGSVVSTTTAAIAYAGGSVVLATLLALGASALWMFTLTLYSKRIASAGGFYSFSSAAWGSKTISFFEALIEVFAYVALNGVNVISTISIAEIAFGMMNLSIPSYCLWLIGAVALIYPTIISLTHVRKVLGYVVTISSTAEVVVLFVLFGLSVYFKGLTLSYLVPTHVSLGQMATAFILSLVSISGSGTATYLGEESKRPTKSITLGMWMATCIGGLAMLLGTYGLVSLWGGDLSSLASANQPLFQEMARFGTIAFSVTALLAVNSLLASNIGTTVSAARILFNVAREGGAPKFLRKLNSSLEPIWATLFTGGLTAVLTLPSMAFQGSQVAMEDVGVIASIFWIAGRIVDSIGAPLFLYRIGSLNIMALLIPLVASGVNIWGLGYSVLGLTFAQRLMISAILLISIAWYAAFGRRSMVGNIVVNEEGELSTREEVIKKLKEINAVS